MLKEELTVNVNVNVNVECSIGGMRQQGKRRSRLKGSDEVSVVAREDRPDESEKRPVRPSKAPLIGKEGIEHLSRS
jgi:hypothetical protein